MVSEVHKLAGRHQAHIYLAFIADIWTDYTYEIEKKVEYPKENKRD